MRYEVTRDGQVISERRRGARGGPLKQTVAASGYLVVNIWEGNECRQRYVHDLVLETFVGPRPPGQECRHLNGVRSDNRLENLAWGTPKQNRDDRVVHGNEVRDRRGRFARRVPASDLG